MIQSNVYDLIKDKADLSATRGERKNKMERYYVVAIRYNSDLGRRENYIAGEFNDYINAELFRRAYDEKYSVESMILHL